MSGNVKTTTRPRRWPRRLLISLLLISVLSLVLAGIGWFWLFHSSSGRDFALGQLVASMGSAKDGQPSLRIGSADGELAGPLQLDNVVVAIGDGMTLRVDRITARFDASALLGRRLSVSELTLQHPILQLGQTTDTRTEDAPWAWPTVRLPLGIEVDAFALTDGELTSADGSHLLGIEQLQLSAGLDRSGNLMLSRFNAESDYGRVESRGESILDGNASGQFRIDWRAAEEQPVLRIDASAKNGAFELVVQAPSQPQQRVTLKVDGESWSLQSQLERLDLRPWLPQASITQLTAQLELEGSGRRADVSGRVVVDQYAVAIDPSVVALSDDASQLLLESLRLRPDDGGSALIEGAIALQSDASHQLHLTLNQMVVPLEGQSPLLVDGDAELAGQPQAWSVDFEGVAQRDGQTLPLKLQGNGDTSHVALSQVRAGDESGVLDGEMQIQWSPTLATEFDLRLQQFDSGRLHDDLAGRLDGRLRGNASQDAEGVWRLDLLVEQLSGTLRELAVSGNGELHLGPDANDSRLNLRVGESHVTIAGQGTEPLDLNVNLDPLRLQDLLPDVAGTLRGRINVGGSVDTPVITAELSGDALQFDDVTAAQMAINGNWSFEPGVAGKLTATARSISRGNALFDTLSLSLSGRPEAHQFELSLDGEQLSLSLASHGAWLDGNWRATIERATVTPQERPPWQLQQPAEISVVDGAITLARSCLRGQIVEICADANAGRDRQTANLQLSKLPLSILAPWLPSEAGQSLAIEGEISGDAQLNRNGESLTGQLNLRSDRGHIAYVVSESQRLLEWNALKLDARLDEQQLRLLLQGQLDDDGHISAELSGPSPLLEPEAPISGRLSIDLPQLRAFSLVEPELSDASAKLNGTLDVGGRWNAPLLSGHVDVNEFNAELPALGIHIANSRLRLDSDDGQRFTVEGEFNSGEGALRLSGSVDPFAEGNRASIRIDGERVLASDTPTLRIIVSPSLTLDWDAEKGLKLRGDVGVPEGRVNLERVEGSYAPSTDVVVLDPRPGREAGSGLPIDASISLVLGEKVRLQGFGFDGRIEGTLALRERPQRGTTARGTLSASGRYRAYGQNLNIVRGRLSFANSSLDNPSLDVRAEREFDRQTVGLEVGGTALLPILQVYSEPALDQAEALSYLVLGRPLRSASSAEGAQLNQAAAAIGGNLLAAQLGNRLGFDTFGVTDSKALGGAAFSVGKYLSPRLYVGYGVSLFGSGQVVTFKYLINRLWEAEVESGTENRVGLNYTLER